jgi:peptidoglycan/LPS O-acetylase OafA/YrhL
VPGQAEQEMPRSSDKPLHGLELLRFFAALAIVIFHYRFYFFSSPQSDLLPFHRALSIIYEDGGLAVPWFWTLSGYIFFWKYGKAVAEGSISAFRFGWLRFSRLYPLHFLTLILTALLLISYNYLFGQPYWFYGHRTMTMFWAHVFFASNWFSSTVTFNGPIWSVSIEVLVYAIFFGLARTLPLHRLGLLVVIVAGFVFGYWVCVQKVQVVPLTWLAQCCVCFFLGGVCRYIGHMPLRLCSALTFLAIASAPLYVFRPAYATAFTFPAIGVLIFSSGPFWNWPLIRRLSEAGNLTYASYLLHFPVALLAVIALKAAGISLAVATSRWFFMSYLIVVFAGAQLCFQFFERPAQMTLRRACHPRRAHIAL